MPQEIIPSWSRLKMEKSRHWQTGRSPIHSSHAKTLSIKDLFSCSPDFRDPPSVRNWYWSPRTFCHCTQHFKVTLVLISEKKFWQAEGRWGGLWRGVCGSTFFICERNLHLCLFYAFLITNIRKLGALLFKILNSSVLWTLEHHYNNRRSSPSCQVLQVIYFSWWHGHLIM